ncbi:hypothetical protein [Kitasatospora purpeofusca]|uniref:hypothetical protein n=1 Tax=Kitasatospora purpeofusca TaxID=67352 RepID=UPI0036D216B4
MSTLAAPSPATSVAALPLDAYEPLPSEMQRINRALEVHAEDCVRRKGLDWPDPVEQPGTPRPSNERRYGISDAGTARAYGYHLPPPIGASRAQQAEARKQAEESKARLSAGAIAAYTGQDSRAPRPDPGRPGCRTEAVRSLGFAAAQDMSITPVTRAKSTAWKSTQADPRAVAANTAWSACMRARGYDYDTPFTAAGDRAWGDLAGLEEPGEREVATATADVDCKQAVGYLATWRDIEARLEDELLAADREAIDETRARWAEALRRADAALKSAS